MESAAAAREIAAGISEHRREDQEKEWAELLEHLPRAELAEYDPGRSCLSGTRTEIVEQVRNWTRDLQGSQVFWITGLAGSGKSTIANTIAGIIDDDEGILGASFFFSRDFADRRNARLVFSTIAFHLGHGDGERSLAERIISALKRDPDAGKGAVANQFEKLLAAPLRALRSAKPIVVVLDALDECEEGRDDLLAVLRHRVPELPKFFKLFITSRSDNKVETTISSLRDSVARHNLSMDDSNTLHDIALYVKSEMDETALQQSQDDDWPGQERRDDLVQRAHGLFIWVRTAGEFLRDPDGPGPEEGLELLLEGGFAASGAEAGLDQLYLTVLTQAYHPQTPDLNLWAFRRVVGAIITLQYPLSPASLDELLDLHAPGCTRPLKSKDVTHRLRSVLDGHDDTDGTVRIIHPSFADYLTDKSRCQDERFWVDRTGENRHLALRSLMTMHELLYQDICNIGDTTKTNSEVPGLHSLIKTHIPSHLRYACVSWAEHLSRVPSDDAELYKLVKSFFFDCLLFWVEAMSLLDAIGSSLRSLERASQWIEAYSAGDVTLCHLVYDARRFVQMFQVPITQSALHTYKSALPFTPKETILYKTFMPQFGKAPKVLRGTASHWTACLHVLEGHTGLVESVAFSPDGKRIVSGSGDKTLRMWDASTGEAVGRPLEGHTRRVRSVAFSPDGKRIVSGSHDNTLRMWDASTGEAVGRPLEGHTGPVDSVAFSPDGKRIVSGSDDDTLQMWDVSTGEAIGKPLEGHTGWVDSVAFSPDGKRIVSRSVEEVRVWKVANDAAIPSGSEGMESQELAEMSQQNLLLVYKGGWVKDDWGRRQWWMPFENRGFAQALHSGRLVVGSLSLAL